MKKRLKYFVLTLFMGAFALSCTKLENTPSFPINASTFTIAAGSSTVAASASDSLKRVLSFSWNDPKFAIGLSNTKFTLMVDSAGNEFKKFVSKTYSDTLGGYLLGKELNSFASQLRKGGTINQQITLEAKVIASTDNSAQLKISNVITVTVTPYGDLVLMATTKSPKTIVCTPLTAGNPADTLSWNEALIGYSGVKTYFIQYAKGGTSFASPSKISITSGFSKSFTQREMNGMAQVAGVTAPSTGDVDFRVGVSNELGAVVYSNTITLKVTTYVAYNSIGLIGDFTGWGNDVDLYRPDPINAPADWTATIYLTGGGGVKFRADDAWNDNWGAGTFPSGTATSGGANIPVSTTGYYKVNFSTASYAYTFTPVVPGAFGSVGLTGDQFGWGGSPDFALTQNGNVWTGTVALTAGGVKFRADQAWATNWGPGSGSANLSGWSVQNGNNINITTAATYFVYINVATGEYLLANISDNSGAATPYASIGLVGDFTGWGGSPDVTMIKDPANPYVWSVKTTFTSAAQVKFRANSDWGTNWGSATFPSGVGNQGGNNLSVPAGTYQITFNSASGEFSFVQ